MTRFVNLSLCSFASLVLALAVTAASPTDAHANPGAGSWCGTCRVADIYVYDLYYQVNGQWVLYGRYFATRYRSNGQVDYGGMLQAQNYIQSMGYAWYRTPPRFWRTTNNG